MQRFEKWFFLPVILFHLLYIWQQKYFLTADGPAHIYNAKVLLDILCGKSAAFYQQYYDLNLKLFPNWFTHAALLPLLALFNPIVAEKILLSAYVIVFPLSFWFAVKQMESRMNLLIILVFPFVFHFLVYYGFYNYSFSIPFALLFIGSWKKVRDASLLKQALILFPLSFLLFTTHIFGWFVAGIFLGNAFLIESIPLKGRMTHRNFFQNFLNKWMIPLIAGLIPVALTLLFMQQNKAEAQYYPEKTNRLWEIFGSLEWLVLWGTDLEKLLVQAMVWLLCVLSFVLLFIRIKNRKPIQLADAWLFSAIVFFIIYFIQPPFLFLGGFWSARMSWIGWLLIAAWLSSFSFPRLIEKAGFSWVLLSLVALAVIRLPFQQKTSDAVEDYHSGIAQIPPESTVLPLSFSHHGMDEQGNRINNYRWQFQHAFDYCGAYKPVINFGNYEACTPWFPVQWKSGCNPFKKFNRGMGMEWNPPDAHLNPFDSSSCHFNIDYVVTWCLTYSYRNTEQWISVNRQLQENYRQIYESPTKRTHVWKRRNSLKAEFAY